jgi:hypothetical protein
MEETGLLSNVGSLPHLKQEWNNFSQMKQAVCGFGMADAD